MLGIICTFTSVLSLRFKKIIIVIITFPTLKLLCLFKEVKKKEILSK